MSNGETKTCTKRRILTVLAVAAFLALLVSVEGAVPALGQYAPNIVGGDEVPDGKYPHIVSVGLKAKGDTAYEQHHCGGTLIDGDSVLTAAHCVDTNTQDKVFEQRPEESMRVTYGRTDLTSNPGGVRDVSQILPYPRYNPNTLAYDVAVLELDGPVTGIGPILFPRLPATTENGLERYGTKLKVAGWGITPYPSPERMHEAQVPVVADSAAEEKYPDYKRSLMVAAGWAGEGACDGDSGGPLFKVVDGRFTQVGIASYGHLKGCARGNPEVYTEVNNPKIRNFIVTAAADDQPFEVTNTKDSGKGSLRQAINAANGNGRTDTIEISATGTVVLRSALPELTTDMDIVGPGANRFAVKRSGASGTPDFRIFTVGEGAKVTVSGMTVTNGVAADCGSNSNPDFLCGGGIGNFGGELVVQDSTISGNEALGRYGAGGGIYNVLGTLTVTGSAMTGNNAVQGGGILNVGGDPGVVKGSTIIGNTAARSGGGIYNAGMLNVEDSAVGGNGADIFGGGIYNNSDLTVVGSAVAENDSENGGGIYSSSTCHNLAKATVTNTTISGNSANGTGGGILNSNICNADSSPMDIGYSTITDNTAPENRGGGVASSGTSGTRTEVFSTIISGNTGHAVAIVEGSTNTFASGGYNLIGGGNATGAFNEAGDRVGVSSPVLGSLAENGGPTRTHALQSGSPAINTGSPNCPPPATDQRGVDRPQRGRCDTGSFELE